MRFLDSRPRRRHAVLALSVAALASTTLLMSSAAGGKETLSAAPAAVDLGNGAVRLAQNAPANVSYSTEQAKRGEAQYKETCVDCHGDDLRGGLNGGPPLRGGMFTMHFGGGPASSLFLFMSTQMPPEAPGRFSASTYADLMAYVLQVNGYDAGAPLPADPDKLNNFIIQK